MLTKYDKKQIYIKLIFYIKKLRQAGIEPATEG